jgi:hypothetical protein
MGRKSRTRFFVTLALPLAGLLAILILLGNALSTTQASTGVVGPGDSDYTIVASVLGADDTDGDGVEDPDDNCPGLYNPGQQDTDGDGLGDVCDPDDDNDGKNDGSDNCPKIYNPGQGDMDGDLRGDACDQDKDGDGHSNSKEWLYGSKDNDNSSTPEHIMVAGTCSDNSDNDGDGLTDGSDPGCDAQPVFDGHLEVHTLTHLKTTADFQVVIPSEGISDTVVVRGDVGVLTTDSVEYGGPGSGTYEVPLEIISLDLVSTAPIVVTGGGPSSTGMITDTNIDPGIDFPAESFFDVYFDPFYYEGDGPYHTEEPMHLEATAPIEQLPPPGTDYVPPDTPVYLYNEDGEIVGDNVPGACPANCATIDVTNLHATGADKYVDRIELDYADGPYPDEGTLLEMVAPGDYSAWIYDLPYYKSQNVMVSVTSVDVNDGPDVPEDSRITFLADVPQGCEGRWVTDVHWPHDILTTDGTVNPDNAMEQVDGDPVTPPGVKVPGDGDPTTIESDLHFQTLEYGEVEDVGVPLDLLRFFEFHCWYDAIDGFDDDGDGLIDEDPVDGQDNEGDGLTDEDPPGFVFTFYNKIEPKETPDPDLTNNWAKATMMVDSLPNGDVDITSWRAPLVVVMQEDTFVDVWVSEGKHNNGPQDIQSWASWIADPLGNPVIPMWLMSGGSVDEFWTDTLYVSSDVVIERPLRIDAPMGSAGGPYEVLLTNDESIEFREPVTGDPMSDPDLSNNIATTSIDVYVLPMGGPTADKEVRDVRLDDASGYPDTEGAPLVFAGSVPAERRTDWVYGSTTGDEYDPLQYLKSQNEMISVISEDWNNGLDPVNDAYVSFLADVPLNCEGRWIPQAGDILTKNGWVDQGDPMNQLEGQILLPDDPDYLKKIPGDGDASTIESDLHFQTSEVEIPYDHLDILRFFEFHCWEAGDFTFTFYNKIEPKDAEDTNMGNNWWKATMLVHSRHNGDVEIIRFVPDLAQPIQTIVSTWRHIGIREYKHNWGPQDVTAEVDWYIDPPPDPNLNVRWVAQPGDLCTGPSGAPPFYYVPCGEGGVAGVPWDPDSLQDPPDPGVDSCQDGKDNDGDGLTDSFDPDCVDIDDLHFSVFLPVSSELPVYRELKVHANVAGSYDLTLWNYEYPEEGTWDPNPDNNLMSLDLDIEGWDSPPLSDKRVNSVVLDYGDNYPDPGSVMPDIGMEPPPRTTEYEYDREYLKSNNVRISVTSYDELASGDIPPDSYVSFLADIPLGCEGRWIPETGPFGQTDWLTEWGTVNPTYPIEQTDGDLVDPGSPKVMGDGDPTTIESDLHFQTADWAIVEEIGVPIPLLRFFEFHCWTDGPKTFTFYNKIEPKTPVEDTDLTNNWWTATMDVYSTPNADKAVDDMYVDADWYAPDMYKLEVLKSENVQVDVTSIDINHGPLQVPDDSYVSFLADIPPECEGRWADDPDYSYDTHTTNGWINIGDPMDQIEGASVDPPTPKVFGDGDPATIESDLHFYTDDYGIPEEIDIPDPLTRTFDLHCVEEGAFIFTFYNKIEPSPPYVDPNMLNNWKAVQLLVNATAPEVPEADKEVQNIRLDDGSGYPDSEGPPLIEVGPGGTRTTEWFYGTEPYLKSQNVKMSVISEDCNRSPDEPVPDAYVSFLADIPLGCEGRWVTDAAEWPYDILTTDGTVDPVDPMDQIDGDPVTPPGDKVPGDGIDTTIESDLHFQTADYGLTEEPDSCVDILRFFEFHCWEGGEKTFTFYNKIEPEDPVVDPIPGNNWWRATLVVNSLHNADLQIADWTAPDPVTAEVGVPVTILVEEDKYNGGPQDTESWAIWIADPDGDPITAEWTESQSDTLEFWVAVDAYDHAYPSKDLEITCNAGGSWTLTLTNDEDNALRDPITHEAMQDPNWGNNTAQITIDVDCEAGPVEPTDKMVVDLKFDVGTEYPAQGKALHMLGPDEPAFIVPVSENVPVSVKSVEYNPGPAIPTNALVNFYADMPMECEGRWMYDPAWNPGDILTIGGDPTALPPGDPAQLGMIVDPPYPMPKIPGDGMPGTYEVDLHFYTADYGITEPLYETVEIMRFFELHCFFEGMFPLTFCNKIEAVDVPDPNYSNNYHCETIWVYAVWPPDLDGDGDTTPDLIDNCPFTPNPDQSDVDGDNYGDLCDICPGTWDPGQEDYDGDGIPGTAPGPTDRFGGDACDPEADNDSKGYGSDPGFFRNSRELFMGTDPLDNCADTSTSRDEEGPGAGEPVSPWPPDFNDTGKVTAGDLQLFAMHYNDALTYDVRYDLNASGPPKITSGDLQVLAYYYVGSGNDTCTVGMP